jgi:peptidoglycan/LPS O-acetylase OafA/YrhL
VEPASRPGQAPAGSAPKATVTGRIPNLDSLRGIAAFGVLTSHVAFATGAVATPFWGAWSSRFEAFVTFFFMLSGFVLSRPYVAASAGRARWPSLLQFYVRRLVRITPAYWTLVVVSFLFLTDTRPDLVTWVKHLTYTQFYPKGKLLEGVGPAWTLTVEAAFYAFLPITAFLVLRRKWRPVRAAIVLMVVGLGISIGWLSQVRPGRLSVYIHPTWFPAFAMAFAAGMTLAVANVALRTGTAPRWWSVLDRVGAAPWACWFVALGLMGLSTTAAGPLGGLGLPNAGDLIVKQLLYVGFAVFLVLPVIFGPATSQDKVLAHPVLRWVGQVSLGLFLWHIVVIDIIKIVYGPVFGANTLWVLVRTAAGGLLCAAASWYLIEKPTQRLAQRLLARRTARRAARAEAAVVEAPAAEASPLGAAQAS